MPRLPLTVLMLGMLLPAGCTHRIWFTQPVREAFELGVVPDVEGEAGVGVPDRAPAELQYFVSDRIVLQREATSRKENIAHGKIHVRKGRNVEEIVVRRGTPGIAVDSGPDWVAVSFEKGTQLVFELVQPDYDAPGVDRDPASYGGEDMPSTYYRLRTTDADDDRWVELSGQRYRAIGQSENARLKVKRTAWTQHRRSRRVMRGLRVH